MRTAIVIALVLVATPAWSQSANIMSGLGLGTSMASMGLGLLERQQNAELQKEQMRQANELHRQELQQAEQLRQESIRERDREQQTGIHRYRAPKKCPFGYYRRHILLDNGERIAECVSEESH